MRVRILGPLSVVDDDGVTTSPRGPQQRRALTALAAHAPEPVAVDTLEDVLWPDGAPSANALQATISKLRRLVAPATIAGDAGRSYALVGAAVDLAEFESALADERWADVERLATDRPLADLDGHPLAEPVVARVDAGRRRAVAARLGESVVASPAAAIAELEAIVAAEPLEEMWWALLMRAQSGAGRRQEALRSYQRARRALADELGLEPGAELRALEAELLTGAVPGQQRAPAPTGGALAPLPQRVGSFVGRRAVVDRLATEIADARLVTVLGPGGAGKTTTALEVAGQGALDAVFVGLSNVSGRHGAVRALARSVGVVLSEQPGTADDDDGLLDRVGAALRDRELLVVLDNCEHLIDVAGEIAHRLLGSCASIAILATSRSPLGVPGERTFPLPPLEPVDAVELLAARAADQGAPLGEADADVAAAICGRLDGLPLAIELAAARLRAMSLVELSSGLDDRFALLTGGPRQAEARQQTMRAVVDWSHELLDDVDRVVFRRLAAFAGGFTLRAAEAVVVDGTTGDVVTAGVVAASIARLVDQSLLVVDRSGDVARFTMLETIADYASERLTDSGDEDHVRRRHARWMAESVQPALAGVISHDQQRWFEWLRIERANHRTAVSTAFARGDAQLALELVAPLGWYFYMAGEMAPAVEAFDRALSLPGDTDPGLRALALGLYGWLLANGPDLERAIATTSQAIALIDRVDDPFARGVIADTHVMALFFAGHIEQAAEFWPTSQIYAEQSGDPWVLAITGVVRGEICQFAGDAAGAERAFTEAADAFEAHGDRFAHALAITEAAELAELVGDYDRALAMLRSGVALADEIGFSGHPIAMRARIANIQILQGDLDAAERGHLALIEDATASGVPWLQSMAQVGLANIARRRGDYETSAERFEAAWQNRRTRTVPYMRAIVLVQRGFLADQRGDPVSAAVDQLEAFEVTTALSAPRGIAFAVEGLAGAMSTSPEPDDRAIGAQLLGRADAIRRGSGGAMPAGERYDLDRIEGRLRTDLGDAEFEAHFAGGVAADVAELAAAARAAAARW